MKRLTGLDDPEKIRTKFDIRTKYVVGMVGTFSEKKDYHTFFRVAKDMASGRNDITFMAVGDGVYFGKFDKMIKAGQRKKIILTGFQEDVESIINVFDIGVLTTYTEGISNAIMEYMALGKPVIATDGGGTSEIIVDKVTGFIIDHAAGEQLKEKIEYLVNNPGQTIVMGRNGRERIMNEFSMDKMIRRTLQLYKEMTGVAVGNKNHQPDAR
ncbi:MAG: glycosyltransferase [Bacteroidales bacterium]